MGAKKRSQEVYLDVVSSRHKLLPQGVYSIHLDSTYFEHGSLVFKGRVLDTMPMVKILPKSEAKKGEQDDTATS